MNFDPISFAMGMNAAKGSEGSSGGGGAVEKGGYIKTTDNYVPAKYNQRWFYLNGELYAIVNQNTTNSVVDVYKIVDGTWTKIVSSFNALMARFNSTNFIVEFHGKAQMLRPEAKSRLAFDGTTLSIPADLPCSCSNSINGGCVHNDELYYWGSDYKIYKWNEATDTWAVVMEFPSSFNYNCSLYSYANNLFVIDGYHKKIYKITDFATSTYELVFTLPDGVNVEFFFNEHLYLRSIQFNMPYAWKRYSFKDNTITELGNAPYLNQYNIYEDRITGFIGGAGSFQNEVELFFVE